MSQPASERAHVLRATGSVIAFWLGIAVLVVVVVGAIWQQSWATSGFVLPIALLLAWALWLLLYRPSVRWDAARVVVTNIGRIHVLPWARVTGVQQRLSLGFALDDGRNVNAVGAPYPRRPGNVERAFGGGRHYDFDRNAELLDDVRDAAAPTGDPVVTRWDLWPLVTGAVLVLAVLVDVLVSSR